MTLILESVMFIVREEKDQLKEKQEKRRETRQKGGAPRVAKNAVEKCAIRFRSLFPG